MPSWLLWGVGIILPIISIYEFITTKNYFKVIKKTKSSESNFILLSLWGGYVLSFFFLIGGIICILGALKIFTP